jgi:hypothetical protein
MEKSTAASNRVTGIINQSQLQKNHVKRKRNVSMISLNFIDSVKLVHQEMESNLRKKRKERRQLEKGKERFHFNQTHIAVPAEEFQKNRVSVIETMAHTVSAEHKFKSAEATAKVAQIKSMAQML